MGAKHNVSVGRMLATGPPFAISLNERVVARGGRMGDFFFQILDFSQSGGPIKQTSHFTNCAMQSAPADDMIINHAAGRQRQKHRERPVL